MGHRLRQAALVVGLATCSGCGIAAVVADRIEAWLGDDEEDDAVPDDATRVDGAASTSAAGSGTDSATTGTTDSGGSPTGASTAETSGASSGASSTGAGIPASFPPPPTTGGDASSSTAGDGGDTGDTGETGDTGGEDTSSTPVVTGVAACLQGTWEVDDFDTYLRHRMRRHARGHKVEAGKVSGVYELEFDPGAGPHGELSIEAKSRTHRYRVELAGLDVEYTVTITGRSVAAYDVVSGKLVVDPPRRGSVHGKLSVDIASEKKVARSVPLPTEGTFFVACAGDDLELTADAGGKKGKPVTYRRK